MPRKPVTDDCLRQCLARLVGRPVHRVPHFVKRYRGYWVYHLMVWCRRVGWNMVLADVSRTCQVAATWPAMWIELGPTKVRGTCHAILVKRGKRSRLTTVWDGGNPIRKTERILILTRAA